MTPSHVNAEVILGGLADLIAEKIKAHFGDMVNVRKAMEEFMEAQRKPTKLKRVK